MSFSKEIEKSLKILKKGKILLYPTDTVWGLGCDAFNINAIKKIYEIKKRNHIKSMIILVDNINRLRNLVGNITDFTKKIILDNFINQQKPITIVYNNIKNNLIKFIHNKNKLAIRLTHDSFCNCLIKELNRPIVSTSANFSGGKTPMKFKEINPIILNSIDYAVNLRRNEKSIYNGSKIIEINSNNFNILRV
ncbi:L-threonylcarbamoyladenylate synthase [Blattabacterium cuenoti]|uniref:L-threonylcarbamoyladenylate synthase n=1 Tax=Blattabacterium cuenoti TaxID=1653831 RepID=UPI00163D0E90|nr:L-threonylcarbamoyladenylate synthase [Blattabacterium cuenoti]